MRRRMSEPTCSTCKETAWGGRWCPNPFHVTGDPAWDSANIQATADRTRSDAALGEALRVAVATVPDGEALVVRVRDGEWRVSIPNGDVSDATIWNDATRRLASLLQRAADPRTETER